MKPHRPILAAILMAGLLLLSQNLFSQCDTVLDKSSLAAGIHIKGISNGQPGNFPMPFTLTSPNGGQLQLTSQALRNPANGDFIPAENIKFNKSLIPIGKGKTVEVVVAAVNIAKPGIYKGNMVIEQPGTDCQWLVPMSLTVHAANQITLLETDQALNLKMVSPSWFNGILPPRLNNKSINFRVENTGTTPIEMSDFSMTLKGTETGEAISEKDLVWENENKTISPGGIAIAKFELDKNKKLRADTYTGRLRLHYDGYPETTTVGVTMAARAGALGAILALLIGIIVGRVIKSVDTSGPQLELMDKLIPLRVRAERIGEVVARNQLVSELDEIESKINEVSDESGKEEIMGLMTPVEGKVKQMRQLETLHERIQEQLKSGNFQVDRGALATNMNLVRDHILEGDTEKVKQGLDNIEKMISVSDTEGTRGFGDEDEDTRSVSDIIKKEKDKIGEVQTTGTATDTGTKSFWQRIESGWLWFISLFSGVSVNARTKYAYLRPLAAMATFLVLVLLGFQQIYVDGGDTFGLGGFYDYLKLFIWGVISDVFSRSLSGGDQGIQAFMGK